VGLGCGKEPRGVSSEQGWSNCCTGGVDVWAKGKNAGWSAGGSFF